MKKIDVIKFFGCRGAPRRIAKVLGITEAAVKLWPDEIPKRRAYELEEITNGALCADPNRTKKHKGEKWTHEQAVLAGEADQERQLRICTPNGAIVGSLYLSMPSLKKLQRGK